MANPQSISMCVIMMGKLRTSTTVSETLGEGMMLNVASILSGSSSRSLFIKSVPRPLPVPPPREWKSWYPWSESHFSACLRM